MIASDAHRALSSEAARKSIVLLKNDAEVLPLKPGSSLAVIGRLANLANTGDDGSSNTRPTHVITPLEGLVAQLDEQVKFADGSDLERAKAVAKEADTVLLIVGYTSADEGEFLSPDTTASLQKLFPRPTLKELPVMPKVLGALNERRKNQATVVGGFSPGGDRDRLELRPTEMSPRFHSGSGCLTRALSTRTCNSRRTRIGSKPRSRSRMQALERAMRLCNCMSLASARASNAHQKNSRRSHEYPCDPEKPKRSRSSFQPRASRILTKTKTISCLSAAVTGCLSGDTRSIRIACGLNSEFERPSRG